MTTLADLSAGQSAVVREVTGDDQIALRLMEMGVTAGQPVSLVGAAPLGDPLEISIRGYRLTLRRIEAQRVQLCSPPDDAS